MNKSELRAHVAELRRRAAEADPGAAAALAAFWPDAIKPTVVGLYRPFRHEMDPWPLARVLGAPTALPVTPPRAADAPLEFRLWSPGDPLHRSAFGVEEPSTDAEPVRPDVLLVPLLAFNGAGHRLGWGAGCYDRTLRSFRASGGVVAIGLAYSAQRRDDLPVEPHDEPLDGVLTEAGYMPAPEV